MTERDSHKKSQPVTEDRVDPVQQVEMWLQQYCQQFNRPWAALAPSHSICFSVIRDTFRSNRTLDDLEALLKRLYAEKQYPKHNYRWFVPVIRTAWEDEDHEFSLKK